MNYQELKNALKKFKSEGLTNIRLNASKAELQAEYDRLVEENKLEVKVEFPDIKESGEADIVEVEESKKAIVEIKDQVEELKKDEIVEIKTDIQEMSHHDEKLDDLLESAYRQVEDDSTDVTSQSGAKFESLIWVVLILISIIGLIFATEKVLSNVKFLSDMYKFSL